MIRRHGHARVSATSPEAFGICDRCAFQYNRNDLRPQMRYTGTTLADSGLRVCSACLDDPNPQLRSRTVLPDPLPIKDPRPGFPWAGPDFITTEAGPTITEEDGDFIIKEPGI